MEERRGRGRGRRKGIKGTEAIGRVEENQEIVSNSYIW